MILPGLKCAGYPACVVWIYTAPSFVIVSATRWRAVVSFGPRSEKFNIVSNDHGRTQKCDFCVLISKTNFTDHHTPHTIHGFRDSVLVCNMHDCYCTIRKISSISIPSHQAMHATAMARPYKNKPLQNAFKRI